MRLELLNDEKNKLYIIVSDAMVKYLSRVNVYLNDMVIKMIASTEILECVYVRERERVLFFSWYKSIFTKLCTLPFSGHQHLGSHI